jgi:hypothetical protein
MRSNPVVLAVATIALLSWANGFAFADDPSSKAADAAPAERAAPAPDAKDDDAAEQAVRDARAFLTLVRDGADEKAYEKMCAAYRMEHTAEELAKDLAGLRDKASLPKLMSVSGDVWLKPKDGSPRATLRAIPSPGGMMGALPRGRSMRPAMLNLSLVQEDGKWKVAGLHDLMERDPAVAIGGAAPRRTGPREPASLRVSSTLQGKLAKVEDGSIVVRMEGKGAAPATGRTLKLDGETVVLLGTEFEGDGPRGPVAGAGRATRTTRITRGAMSDVKVDRRVTVETSDDGTRAESVTVMQEAATPSEGL